MEKALEYAKQHGDRFVTELEDFLRIPSISTDPAYAGDVRRAAEWLADNLRRVGMEKVEVMDTPGHPIVYAEHVVDPSRPTVLVYGHYDVQPPDPMELWESPPFEPVRKNGTLYARGSSDDKGQAFMHVKAAEAWLQGGDGLPVNLKFMIEGEEESGSSSLRPFIEGHKDLLAADIVMISDTSLFDEGVPSITYGLRGLAYCEVTLTGPSRDLHSGVYGGAVENPINALARLIAGLHDERHRVTVEVGGRRLEVVLPAGLAAVGAGAAVGTAKKPKREKKKSASATSGDTLTSPMQGTIVKVAVEEGQGVAEGEVVVVLEAMKMEQPVKAHKAGTVTGLEAEVGATVTSGAVICELKD